MNLSVTNQVVHFILMNPAHVKLTPGHDMKKVAAVGCRPQAGAPGINHRANTCPLSQADELTAAFNM